MHSPCSSGKALPLQNHRFFFNSDLLWQKYNTETQTEFLTLAVKSQLTGQNLLLIWTLKQKKKQHNGFNDL